MKRSIIQLVAFCLLTLPFGCYYDDPQPDFGLDGPPEFVSFQNDLVPIFDSNCNSSGCHDAVPAHDPSLVGDQAFNAIVNGGYVNTVAPKSSILFNAVNNGSMPPSAPLTQEEVKKILDWIRNGSPNN